MIVATCCILDKKSNTFNLVIACKQCCPEEHLTNNWWPWNTETSNSLYVLR